MSEAMIIDCFPFFNELDVLEIRLRELSQVVDRFVLCELTRTFTGHGKPLHFRANAERFGKFSDQIVVTPATPPAFGTCWELDRWQKNAPIQYVAPQLTSDDFLLVCDLDEIPRADVVARLTGNWAGPVRLDMPIHRMWLDAVSDQSSDKAFLIRWGEFNAQNQDVWDIRERRPFPVVRDAGWHFSSMGDIRDKLNAFSHQEFNRPDLNDLARIQQRRRQLADPLGRTHVHYRLCEESSLPQCVQEHRERYAHLLYKGGL